LVEIRNAKLGLLHLGLQLAIIAYVIAYVIVWNQGYQTESKMVPSFFTKTKGVGHTFSQTSNKSLIMDANDLVLPPLEQDAIFLGMKFALTKGQRRGVCSGNYNSSGADGELCENGCEAG
jgi:P2X purinoceptor 1